MSDPPRARRPDDEIRAALRACFTGNPAKDLAGFRIDELAIAEEEYAALCVRSACKRYPR